MTLPIFQDVTQAINNTYAILYRQMDNNFKETLNSSTSKILLNHAQQFEETIYSTTLNINVCDYFLLQGLTLYLHLLAINYQTNANPEQEDQFRAVVDLFWDVFKRIPTFADTALKTENIDPKKWEDLIKHWYTIGNALKEKRELHDVSDDSDEVDCLATVYFDQEEDDCASIYSELSEDSDSEETELKLLEQAKELQTRFAMKAKK